MKQIALDLSSAPAPSFENFVTGPNAELLSAVRARASHVYFWGVAGSGKSHLLGAAARASAGRLLDPEAPIEQFRFDPACGLYAVDDADLLSPTRQEALFHLYNRVRESAVQAEAACILCSGKAAPMALAVREDLRTRLGWGLVFQIHQLSDEAKAGALAAMAELRGLRLAPDVIPFVLSHFHRDMARLTALLEALDRFSMERKRPVTIPLLKDMLSETDLLSNPDEPCAV